MAHWARLELTSETINQRFNKELKENGIAEVTVTWTESIDQSSRWRVSFNNVEGVSVGRFRFGQIYECCGAALAYVASRPHGAASMKSELLMSIIEWCAHKVNVGSIYIIVREGNDAYSALNMNANYEPRPGWTFITKNKNPRSHNILFHWLGIRSGFKTKRDRS